MVTSLILESSNTCAKIYKILRFVYKRRHSKRQEKKITFFLSLLYLDVLNRKKGKINIPESLKEMENWIRDFLLEKNFYSYVFKVSLFVPLKEYLNYITSLLNCCRDNKSEIALGNLRQMYLLVQSSLFLNEKGWAVYRPV